MNRTDRLTGILLALRNGQQTAAQLATRFAVSRRTILRDLDALGELGVPVIATPGTGGGFALPEGYWLPPLRLSAAEATVVLLGLAALGPPATSPFGEPRRTAEEKIRAIIHPDTLRTSDDALRHISFDSGPATPDAVHIELLRDTVGTDQWLRIAYRSTRRVADHEVLPLRLVVAEGRWYLDAISREAQARRRYRIDRIDAIRSIPRPTDADRIVAAADIPSDYHHPDHPEVVLLLTETGIVRAPDLLGVRVAPERHLDDKWEIRFRCPPSELPFYARCVLTLGDEGLAVSPPELVALVRETARRALDRHPELALRLVTQRCHHGTSMLRFRPESMGQGGAMSPASTVRKLWESFEQRDWEVAASLLHRAVIVRWPASREEFAGRDAIMAVNRNYPGDWHIRIDEVIATGDRAVSRVTVTLDGSVETCVGFYTVRSNEIVEADEWWITPYHPPPWRQTSAATT